MERNENEPFVEASNPVGGQSSPIPSTSSQQLPYILDDQAFRQLGGTENFDSLEWDEYLLRQLIASQCIINASRTRLLILSGTDLQEETNEYDEEILTVLTDESLKSTAILKNDNDKIRQLQMNPNTNKIQFNIIDISAYFEDSLSMSKKELDGKKSKLIQDIQQLQPTVIILPFMAVKFPNKSKGKKTLNIVEKVNALDKNGMSSLDGMDGVVGSDIAKFLRKKPGLWQNEGLVIATENCLIFKTRNIFQTNKTLLTSHTRTTACGIEESVPVLLDHVKLWLGPKNTRILKSSGRHGNLIEGISGFSSDYDMNGAKLLDHKFYEEACKIIGIKPQDKNDTNIPSPVAQKRDPDAAEDCLLRNPLYKFIQFNVLNIKHFQKNGKGLVKYVRDFDPSAIIIDWCFSPKTGMSHFF